MRKLFLSLAILFLSASSALAATSANLVSTEKRFFLDSDAGFGSEVYYNCRDVEIRLRSFLSEMGAQNVRVLCTGGIDNFVPPVAWHAFVEISFQSLKLNETGSGDNLIAAQWKPVDIWETGSCQIYSQVFDEVKDSFSIRNLEEPWHCFSSDSSFRLKLETLFKAGT